MLDFLGQVYYEVFCHGIICPLLLRGLKVILGSLNSHNFRKPSKSLQSLDLHSVCVRIKRVLYELFMVVREKLCNIS